MLVSTMNHFLCGDSSTRNGHRFLGMDGSLASAMAQLEPDVSFKGLFEMEMMYLYISNIMCIYIYI